MGRPAQYSTLTSCPRIGIRDLTRHDLVDRASESIWPFTGGYRVKVNTGGGVIRLECGDVKTVVGIEHVPMRFGGHRIWFRCPGCYRRRGMMFLGTNTWACRVCFRLKYPSSREDRHGRLGTKLAKKLRRLGATYPANPRWVEKPKRMRWPTYERLRAEAQELDHQMAVELLGMIGSKFGSMEHLLQRTRLP